MIPPTNRAHAHGRLNNIAPIPVIPRHIAFSSAPAIIPTMLRFLFWRLIQSLIVLWAVYTVTFFLLILTPGDPFVGEKKLNETARRALAERFGLDYLAQGKRFKD